MNPFDLYYFRSLLDFDPHPPNKKKAETKITNQENKWKDKNLLITTFRSEMKFSITVKASFFIINLRLY